MTRSVHQRNLRDSTSDIHPAHNIAGPSNDTHCLPHSSQKETKLAVGSKRKKALENKSSIKKCARFSQYQENDG